jgi:uroporphyrinogen III methyltransferase/synthase
MSRGMDPERPAQPGVVHLVGAGPGDPGLVTRRAVALVESADVLYVDRLGTQHLVTNAKPNAQIIDVGKVAGNHAMAQDEINARLVADAQRGLRVVRLKGGDPYLFGRGGEEAAFCRAAGVAFEVVPAVTSAFGASAAAGIPVTHRDLSRHVTVVTASAGRDGTGDPDYAWLAKSDGTIVFLMGLRRTAHVCEQLIAGGMDAQMPVAIVARGTTAEQRTVTGTLATIAAELERTPVPSPAIIVVGRVVELREQLSWFEQRPLFGLKIAVTRARAQASKLAAQLRALGADVVEAPQLRFAPLPWDELDALLDDVSSLGTLVFTSANAVTPFFVRLTQRGLDARALAGAKVAVVGQATFDACVTFGVRPDIMPSIGARTSVGVLDTLGTDGAIFGTRVGIVRAQQGDDRLIDGLEQLGARVQLARVYTTVRDEIDEEMRTQLRRCDLVTLTSESTVKNLVEGMGTQAGLLPPAIAIGPTTATAAKWANLELVGEAADPSIEALTDAVLAWAAQR